MSSSRRASSSPGSPPKERRRHSDIKKRDEALDPELEEDASHLRDAWSALDAFFRDDPYFLTRHHIDSYDRFLDSGLAETVRNMKTISLLKTDDKGRTVSVEIAIGSMEVRVDVPTIAIGGGNARPLLPNEARLRDMTYAVNVYADVSVEYVVDGEVVEAPPSARPICLGQVPLMLHSRHCLLHGLSPEALRHAGECPYDRGGYFVVDGKEKIVLPQEAPVKNRVYVRRGEASDPDVAYLAFLRCDSPKDSFPRTTTFYVRSNEASSRPGTVSVIVTHLGNVRSGPSDHGQATHAIKKSVPLFVLFRALGIESDRDILRHIVYDVDAPDTADMIEFLRPSAVDAGKRGLTDQRTSLAWLQQLVRGTDSIKQVLVDDLLPNVGTDFRAKALALGDAVARVVRVALGKVPPPERDDYANKRLDLSGFLIGDLFRDIFLRIRRQSIARLESEWNSGPWRATGDVTKLINASNLGAIFEGGLLTERLRRSMKGDWGPDEDSAEAAEDADAGVVQDLARMSYMSYVSHVRRLNNPVDRSVKMADPHKLRASHWGAVCPIESPDGPNVGLLNHLATLATVSLGSDAEPARRAVLGSGLAAPLSAVANGRVDLLALRGTCKVLVNDTWLAITHDPPALLALLRGMRRRHEGGIAADTSFAWSIQERELHVHTDRGRFMRPLAIVTPAPGADPSRGAPLPSLPLPLRAAVRASAKSGAQLSWRGDLLEPPTSGSLLAPLELVDVEELRTLMVAMRPSDIGRVVDGRSARGERYTHCELHVGAALLSPSANVFPMLHMNNAPRNVFGIGQFKQALGTYSTAFLSRMDTHGYVLHHPQRPLVGTSFADKLCLGQLALGENVVVAVCSYTGYNMEDSVLVNRDSVERGRFHVTAYETHKFAETSGRGGVDEPSVAFANALQIEAAGGGPVTGVKKEPGAYDAIGPDGLPEPDSEVPEGGVLVGRVAFFPSPSASASALGGSRVLPQKEQQPPADRSAVASRKTAGTVDRVFVYPSPLPGDGAARWCKVRTRQHRAPVLGDKIGSRYSQKGVIGMLLPACDMPFSAVSGLVPDIVINPHGFPSRNTVAHLVECLLGRAGAEAGARYNVNSLEEPRGDPVKEAADVLEKHGLHSAGEELLHNGRSGEQMQVDVFVGINYYGRLKHMVTDKYQHRLRGPVNAITRQPAKTAGGSGGLRIGEMEQNALLAHGVSNFLKESFCERSDGHHMVIDADEGVPALVQDPSHTRAHAGSVGAVSGGPPRFANVQVPYTFKLLQQELHAMSIGLALRTEGADLPSEEEEDEQMQQQSGGPGDDEEDVGEEAKSGEREKDAAGDIGDGAGEDAGEGPDANE